MAIIGENSLSFPIDIRRFMRLFFDSAAEIGQAILAARSLRLTEIAAQMYGTFSAAYKRIQRFLKGADPRGVLWRLLDDHAEFVIADPTEIERPQARKTE